MKPASLATPHSLRAPLRSVVALARPRSGSWMSLLASTTPGMESADTLRVVVTAEEGELLDGGEYRLVVQSFDDAAAVDRARPAASAQRAVSAADMLRGVPVDLLELAHRVTPGSQPIVVAWVEAGKPDLEFDGLRARPTRDCAYGSVRRGASRSVSVVARRQRLAAA